MRWGWALIDLNLDLCYTVSVNSKPYDKTSGLAGLLQIGCT